MLKSRQIADNTDEKMLILQVNYDQIKDQNTQLTNELR